jgi:hypothetical protein
MNREQLASLTWEGLATELLAASNEYGCGFYSEPRWCMAYDEMARRVGAEGGYHHEKWRA